MRHLVKFDSILEAAKEKTIIGHILRLSHSSYAIDSYFYFKLTPTLEQKDRCVLLFCEENGCEYDDVDISVDILEDGLESIK